MKLLVGLNDVLKSSNFSAYTVVILIEKRLNFEIFAFKRAFPSTVFHSTLRRNNGAPFMTKPASSIDFYDGMRVNLGSCPDPSSLLLHPASRYASNENNHPERQLSLIIPGDVLRMISRRYHCRGDARIYNLIQALDSCDGAAADSREAISFLRNLRRTLGPLKTFAAWNEYPEYGQDIGEQVAHIKEHVENFLATMLEFEPSLGNAKKGRHRHVPRKLQWRVLVSKKVLVLKKKIESRLRVIDTLIQRLTL